MNLRRIRHDVPRSLRVRAIASCKICCATDLPTMLSRQPCGLDWRAGRRGGGWLDDELPEASRRQYVHIAASVREQVLQSNVPIWRLRAQSPLGGNCAPLRAKCDVTERRARVGYRTSATDKQSGEARRRGAGSVRAWLARELLRNAWLPRTTPR